jgi:hypothetical protein
MTQSASHYPISQAISSLMDEYCFSRVELIHALGFDDVDCGLRHLNSCMGRGENCDRIITQIAAVYPAHSEKLQKAVAETLRLKAAESEAAFLELRKVEEAGFTPFIYADGERTVPNGIVIFGITGGHDAWTTITVPKTMLELPLETQLAQVPKLMDEYRRRFNGACPFFGKLTGFKFVRYFEFFQFDAHGKFVERIEEQFRLGCVEVYLR